MEVHICQTFPALDPLRLRREKCGEVLLLLRRMIRYNNWQQEACSEDGEAPTVPADDDVIVVRKKNGDTITMRRAKNDAKW